MKARDSEAVAADWISSFIAIFLIGLESWILLLVNTESPQGDARRTRADFRHSLDFGYN